MFTGLCESVYPSEGQLLQGADKTEGMRVREDKAQQSRRFLSVDGGRLNQKLKEGKEIRARPYGFPCRSFRFLGVFSVLKRPMTVTFVPPRTLIRGVVPSTIVSTDVSHAVGRGEAEDDLDGDVEMGGMDEHGGGSLLTKKLVVPGQLVTDDPQFMRCVPDPF